MRRLLERTRALIRGRRRSQMQLANGSVYTFVETRSGNFHPPFVPSIAWSCFCACHGHEKRSEILFCACCHSGRGMNGETDESPPQDHPA